MKLLSMLLENAPQRLARPRRAVRDTAPNRRGTAITADEARCHRNRMRQLRRAIAIALQHGKNPIMLIDCFAVVHLLHTRQPLLMTALTPPVRYLRIRDLPDDGGHNSNIREDFRFKLSDMATLVDALDLPCDADDFVRTPRKRYKYHNEEGLLMWLMYFAKVGTLSRLSSVFGGSKSRSSEIVNDVTRRIYQRWHHRIIHSDLRHMEPIITRHYKAAARKVGGEANLPWHVGLPVGFVDAKCLKICRPSWGEGVCYSGYKHMHSINFQILGRLDGIVEDLHGPIEGRHSDPYLFRGSRLQARFRAMRNRVWDNEYALHPILPLFKMYADGIYAMSDVMGRNFRQPMTVAQAAANALMSTLRGEVEHMFAKPSNLFRQVHYHTNNKILASPVGTQYIVAQLLSNAHTCFYGNQTQTNCFNLPRPYIYQYFS